MVPVYDPAWPNEPLKKEAESKPNHEVSPGCRRTQASDPYEQESEGKRSVESCAPNRSSPQLLLLFTV